MEKISDYIAMAYLYRNMLVIGLFFLAMGCNSEEDMTVIHPAEIDRALVNPGRGFATTGTSYNEDLGDKRHPQSGVVQMRWYWDKLEPEEGKIDYAFIDDKVKAAHENGQQLNFRVMCQNVKMRLPQWLIDKGIKQPYYDNPVFLQEHEKLIKALADRYDGNPDIAFVDIGTVGQWGEWHTTLEGQGVKMPSKENQKKIIDMYVNNFQETPLVMLIGGERDGMLGYAVDKGAGWRADCWGGYGSVGFHAMEQYPGFLSSADAYDAWKQAPVALETCYTMSKWQEEGWGIDSTLSKALEWHATEVNNGTQAIPEEWWTKVKSFEKKLGYRFVLDELRFSSKVKAGGKMSYSMTWQNKGVAPIYHAFPLAFRFQSVKDSTNSVVVKTGEDITKWMPGITKLNSKVKIPANISSGNYTVDIGIINPQTDKPMVNLAIKGKTTDGWYKLEKIEVSGS